jgi:hypothetical protein
MILLRQSSAAHEINIFELREKEIKYVCHAASGARDCAIFVVSLPANLRPLFPRSSRAASITYAIGAAAAAALCSFVYAE